jgi:DNA-binding transcriptional MerR regulator
VALYTIGALAQKSGVPIKTIRYYSDLGLLPPRSRTDARYRLYGDEDRARLELIRALRSFDFALDDITRLLAGRASVHAVLALQLEQVEAAIGRFGRTRAVLREALRRPAGDDERLACLGRLHALALLGRSERQALLSRALAGALGEVPIDNSWLAWLHEAAFAGLPDELDATQWEALVELCELVHDEGFGRRLAAQSRRFWTAARRFDRVRWQAAMAELVSGATRALARGEPPDGAAARPLVDALVRAWAEALGRRPGPALARSVLAEVDAHDPRAERFWDLVAAAQGRPPSPHARALRWLFDGLRASLSQTARGRRPKLRQRDAKPAKPR